MPADAGSCDPIPAVTAPEAELGLSEMYFQGFLDDLVATSPSLGLTKFIRSIFTADSRQFSGLATKQLATALLNWTSAQPRGVREVVWTSFGTCGWVKPILELVERMPADKQQVLMDLDPSVYDETIAPWLGDRPGCVLIRPRPSTQAN